MTISLDNTDFAVPATRAAVRRSATPARAVVWLTRGTLLLVSWTASVLLAVDGLVRGISSPSLAFAEIGVAAVPAMVGVAAVLPAARRAARTWIWLGALPSLAGWLCLAQLG